MTDPIARLRGQPSATGRPRGLPRSRVRELPVVSKTIELVRGGSESQAAWTTGRKRAPTTCPTRSKRSVAAQVDFRPRAHPCCEVHAQNPNQSCIACEASKAACSRRRRE